MNYVPQIPKWGEEYTEKKLDELVSYHGWLASTAIKTGLISPKKEQAIWDEFIVHSLYFAKIIENLKKRKEQILDLGTGCLLYTSPSPRDRTRSRMPSSA